MALDHIKRRLMLVFALVGVDSQAAFCALIGISKSAMSKIVSGDQDTAPGHVPLPTLAKIADEMAKHSDGRFGPDRARALFTGEFDTLSQELFKISPAMLQEVLKDLDPSLDVQPRRVRPGTMNMVGISRPQPLDALHISPGDLVAFSFSVAEAGGDLAVLCNSRDGWQLLTPGDINHDTLKAGWNAYPARAQGLPLIIDWREGDEWVAYRFIFFETPAGVTFDIRNIDGDLKETLEPEEFARAAAILKRLANEKTLRWGQAQVVVDRRP